MPGEETRRAQRVSYLATLFEKYLVIFRERDAKNDGRNVLKAVNPLFPLATLSTNIKHTANTLAPEIQRRRNGRRVLNALYAELAHLESCFIYASGLGTSSQNVHLIREIVDGNYAHHLLKEAAEKGSAVSTCSNRLWGLLQTWTALTTLPSPSDKTRSDAPSICPLRGPPTTTV